MLKFTKQFTSDYLQHFLLVSGWDLDGGREGVTTGLWVWGACSLLARSWKASWIPKFFFADRIWTPMNSYKFAKLLAVAKSTSASRSLLFPISIRTALGAKFSQSLTH